MMEREPDFEDDKIRAWTASPEDQRLEEIGRDPTMLSLDMEKEEVFESRTYRFRPGPEALAYFVDLVSSQKHQLELSSGEILQAARELMAGITLKFLAKRRKEDGLIDSLLIAVKGNDRCLLSRQEWVEESEYLQKVQDFETGFLPGGVLSPPLVVAPEEWQRYSQEGPFSEAIPGPKGQ